MKKTAFALALLLFSVFTMIFALASSMNPNLPADLPSESEHPKMTDNPAPSAPPQITPIPTAHPTQTETWGQPVRISFQVTMNPCLSGQGNRIAFTFTGLYVMNSDGTRLRQLTGDYDAQPSISADGERIAFRASSAVSSGPPYFTHTHYSSLYVVNSDGTGLAKLVSYLKLSDGQHSISAPSISGDGRKVAFVSGSLLNVISFDGTGLKSIAYSATGAPSMSADGMRIAFSAMVGDCSELFLVNSDGTGLVQLTNMSSSIGSVALSGDAGKVAFTLHEDWFNVGLYVVNSDGTGLIKLSGGVNGVPSISCDGGRIAFVSTTSSGLATNHELCVASSDGAKMTRIASSAEAFQGPSINGDGRKLVFSYLLENGTFVSELVDTVNPTPPPLPVEPERWSIPIQITSRTWEINPNGLALSANGKKIAFNILMGDNTYELYAINSDPTSLYGTDLAKLFGKTEWIGRPSISADGSKVAFIANDDLYVANSDETGYTELLSNLTFADPVHNSGPSISLDGTRVAVVVEVDHVNVEPNYDLWIINSDGTGLVTLPNDAIYQTWIGAGAEKLAFVSGNDLYLVNSDGTGLEQFVSDIGGFPYITSPSISQNGNKLAFLAGENYSEVYVMNLDGTGLKQLTNNMVNEWSPAISADGNKVVFVSGSLGSSEIFAVKSDGTELTQITQNQVEDREPCISGDGSRVVFYEPFVGPFTSVAIG